MRPSPIVAMILAGHARRAPRPSAAALGRGTAWGPASQLEPDPTQHAEGEPARPRSCGDPGREEVALPGLHDQVGEGIHASHRPATQP
jgi:hypothetical protein